MACGVNAPCCIDFPGHTKQDRAPCVARKKVARCSSHAASHCHLPSPLQQYHHLRIQCSTTTLKPKWRSTSEIKVAWPTERWRPRRHQAQSVGVYISGVKIQCSLTSNRICTIRFFVFVQLPLFPRSSIWLLAVSYTMSSALSCSESVERPTHLKRPNTSSSTGPETNESCIVIVLHVVADPWAHLKSTRDFNASEEGRYQLSLVIAFEFPHTPNVSKCIL
jgi:hypothetical protein